MPERIFRGYREPAAVAAGLTLHHALMVLTAWAAMSPRKLTAGTVVSLVTYQTSGGVLALRGDFSPLMFGGHYMGRW